MRERAVASRHWEAKLAAGRTTVAMHPNDTGGEILRVWHCLRIQLQEVFNQEANPAIFRAGLKFAQAENARYQAWAGCVDRAKGRVFSLEHHLTVVTASALKIVRLDRVCVWVQISVVAQAFYLP